MRLGRYPDSWIILSTCSRTSGRTCGLLESTRDTVATETPAFFAISLIPAIKLFPLSAHMESIYRNRFHHYRLTMSTNSVNLLPKIGCNFIFPQVGLFILLTKIL